MIKCCVTFHKGVRKVEVKYSAPQARTYTQTLFLTNTHTHSCTGSHIRYIHWLGTFLWKSVPHRIIVCMYTTPRVGISI